MHLKDYYRILELEPSATQTEIKKAYWRLAQLHHPDKNNNDPYAAALFAEVKEAYEVLTNPSRKAYYLQQRWYDQSTGKKRKHEVVTPVSVLKQALELDKYISTLDIHRMDKDGLYDYINGILSDETLAKLDNFKEPAIMKEIVFTLLRGSHLLKPEQFAGLSVKLKKLSVEPVVMQAIDLQAERLNKRKQWDLYMPWFLLLIVILICVLIFLLNN